MFRLSCLATVFFSTKSATIPILGLFDADTYPSFGDVKSALEEVYPCLGITCAQVGALVGGDGTPLDNKTAACAREPIAGYIPGSDVTEHNKIDLDQAAMEAALASDVEDNFEQATTVYTEGGNSVSKGSFRTLQGFSTGAQAKMYDSCPGS